MKPSICALLVSCCAALGQQPAAKISFEVVSIKPAAPSPMGQMRMNRGGDPGRARFSNFSLRDYIRVAYRVKDFQVEGPEWIDNARFDVEGKFPEGATEAQVPEMLQSMLADRFKLTLHRNTKEHAIFALVAGKGGPKLKASEAAPGDGGAPGGDPGRGGRGGMPRGGMMMQIDDAGAHLKASGVTLATLAEMISRFTEQPVVDMSGIEGQYDFDLLLAPEALRNGAGGGGGGRGPGPIGGAPAPQSEGANPVPQAQSSRAGTMHEAVQAYGLKLEPRKAQMEILSVDHIEKTPTEN
jgi:uncharacterized protein (TIGR03435 family)